MRPYEQQYSGHAEGESDFETDVPVVYLTTNSLTLTYTRFHPSVS